ncbi:HAD-IA family hydrolase [Henriciella aquimarina]|uniref:HAD-IA family hydrolase n=1 Tax=Henriciella aquimarina TaxID=545261 RepID=UPI000A06C148|nr:HAD-IA family hydrolase [Henriciella aquimarina]
MTDANLKGWTIVFDLDGTLVDTAPDLHAALNHCLAAAGYNTVPFEAIRGMIGDGAKAMIRKGLEADGVAPEDPVVEPLWTGFLEHYRANICRLSRPFPDALDTLSRLIGQGARCAVCTNKTQQLAEEVLNGLELTRYFDAVVGADSVPEKKPHGGHILQTIAEAGGTPERAIMVGDSLTDERAARNAGLPFIFVPFGYGPEPETPLETLLVAETYSDLSAVILSVTA